MEEYFEKIHKEHPLLAWIFIGMALVTIVGLAVILPLVFTISFKCLWFLLLYLPVVGVLIGVCCYMENDY